MAEVLVQYDVVMPGPEGRGYVPRACGRPMPDGRLWEGWIEFVPADGSEVLRTRRETEQPNRDDLHYWATGLTVAYLEGALARALEPPRPPRRSVDVTPAYEGPAPERAPAPAEPRIPARQRPVLDPFEVYRQGEDVLRKELRALDVGHLRTIAEAVVGVAEDPGAVGRPPREASRVELAEWIVASVAKTAGRGHIPLDG